MKELGVCVLALTEPEAWRLRDLIRKQEKPSPQLLSVLDMLERPLRISRVDASELIEECEREMEVTAR